MKHARWILGVSFCFVLCIALWNISIGQQDLPPNHPPLVRSPAMHDLHQRTQQRHEQLLISIEEALSDETFRIRTLELLNASIQEHGIQGQRFGDRAPNPPKPWYKRLIAVITCSEPRH